MQPSRQFNNLAMAAAWLLGPPLGMALWMLALMAFIGGYGFFFAVLGLNVAYLGGLLCWPLTHRHVLKGEAYIRRLTIIGAFSGFVISLPIWIVMFGAFFEAIVIQISIICAGASVAFSCASLYYVFDRLISKFSKADIQS